MSAMDELKEWLDYETKKVCKNLEPSEHSDELAMIQKIQAVISTIESKSLKGRFRYFKQLLSLTKGIFK